MTDPNNNNESSAGAATRRELIKATAATGAAALLASGNYAFAQGSDQIKIALIGCGGRGTGAAMQALNADPGVVLMAMGDVFDRQIDEHHKALKDEPTVATR